MNVRGVNSNSDKCEDIVKNYWISIPSWTKRVSVLSTLILIFSFFLGVGILVNFPIVTIFKFHFFTVVTSPFVHLGVINLLISLLVFVPRASTEELNLGSQVFIWDFMTKNVAMQIMFTLIMLPASMIIPKASIFPACGLWNIALIYISQGSFKFPDHVMPLCGLPIKITHIWYPPILLLIFMGLSGGILFDLLVSYAFSYLEFRFFGCSFYEYPIKWYNYVTSCWLCKKLGMNSVDKPFDQGSSSSANTINNTSSSTGNFKEFKGKGVTIGESTEDYDSPKPIKDEEIERNEDYQSFPLPQNKSNNPESNNYFSLIDEQK